MKTYAVLGEGIDNLILVQFPEGVGLNSVHFMLLSNIGVILLIITPYQALKATPMINLAN